MKRYFDESVKSFYNNETLSKRLDSFYTNWIKFKF